jgi:hypothetical protein
MPAVNRRNDRQVARCHSYFASQSINSARNLSCNSCPSSTDAPTTPEPLGFAVATAMPSRLLSYFMPLSPQVESESAHVPNRTNRAPGFFVLAPSPSTLLFRIAFRAETRLICSIKWKHVPSVQACLFRRLVSEPSSRIHFSLLNGVLETTYKSIFKRFVNVQI